MSENIINKINLNGVNYSIQEEKLIKTTYSELKSLRDNSKLVPGCQYRITDYEFTTKQEKTKSAGNVFDIIVLATDENQLSELARAIQHEGDTYFDGNDLGAWELWYDLDNDADKYNWADTENGKGIIYRMIDEKRNDCPYDFKNALFHNTKLTIMTTTDKYYYTFSYVISSGLYDGTLYDGTVEKQVKDCHDNSMGVYLASNKKFLNFNVFRNTSFTLFTSCSSNTFGNSCNNNTFGDSCNNNTFGSSCDNNTFGSSCNNNTFGNSCNSNTFGNNYKFNTFKSSCNSNTFGNSCNSNTFGNECDNNTFGNECDNNTFEDSCNSNTFGNSCNSNTFGNECDNNTFEDFCDNNTFEDFCYSNTFGNKCNYNTFKNSCYSNTFRNECKSNTFKNTCYSNTFGGSCHNNTFGNSCSYNTFGNYCSRNTFENNTFNYKGNVNKTSITFNDEYYNDGSGQLVPIKYPDLSTQPSILPYKFMGQYVYEQLIPVKVGDRIVNCDFEVEYPMILSSGVFGFNSFKNVDIIATKSDALLLNTESELSGYINVKYTDGTQFLPSKPSNPNGYGYYGYEDNNTESSTLLDFGVSSDGTQYIYDPNIETLSLYKSGEITEDSIPQNLQKENIISIILSDGVTSIGGYAFYKCTSLTAINIPEGVTSIGNSAFEGCSSLTSITIPESVTSIGGYAFGGCSGLTAMVVAEGNEVYDSRGDCNAIIETASNVLIAGCSTTIIPESVTSIGNSAFYDCYSLTSITLPEGMTSIGENAFSSCLGLTSINISESVTSIGRNAFYDCRSLTSITLPEGVTSIGAWTLIGCSSLTSITSKAIIPPSEHKYAFNGVNESIPVYVPAESVDAYKASEVWKDFTNIQAI